MNLGFKVGSFSFRHRLYYLGNYSITICEIHNKNKFRKTWRGEDKLLLLREGRGPKHPNEVQVTAEYILGWGVDNT